ncbi:hypothetical protein SO802_012712 [Lithocarpus litseifolius]|uniref:PGG domain-containing protein n=1 Tax=Lithocarpus litseifolius TaxID=425828 RepID=A0AAW2D8Z4_9ROSI
MARNNVDYECGKLYQAALNGDWESVKDMLNIQRKITSKDETTLHIAAAANQEEFVKKLLKWMTLRNYSLKAVNIIGNTALTYAAATGNVNIATAMVEINSDLPNLNSGKTPLYMAAFLGHTKMADYLYSKTSGVVCRWDVDQQADLFMTCVKSGVYGVALEMLKAKPNLAKHNKDGETALYVLASNPSAFFSETRPWLKLKKENSKQSQANKLFENCLHAYRGDVENSLVIENALFDAAEEGNIECLIKLIHFDFGLLWKTKGKKSIFHVAVEKRHESIFYLLKEIGSVGDLIINSKIENIGNILHLAAELAPKEKLNALSGAALQMQQEIFWFKEVEKIVPPEFKEMKNRDGDDGEKPYVLFARTHEELRTKGEKWMINTANYSMLVSTIIGSIMFPGLIAEGLDNNSPNLYLVFSVASVIALFSSSTSLVMFLSILTSRYSYNDFLLWLPLRLLIGVATLCISIAAMMVAFFTSFMLKNFNRKELPVIFAVIGLFACAPILYVLLKWYLFADIARSTFFQWKPRQRILYKKVSHEPASPANRTSQQLANQATV